ncbi:MAG: hypothetical protein NZL92_12420, partial [Gloeomargarita sp. SKYG116]|nr:hypothetical protein [Gloeomargarita sp. SKYG116]MDW8402484.1 hypothetical protein [Gloeomargarita sp. SKYGB_i_bin116]
MPLSKTLIELHLTATLTDERRSEVISQNFWKLWVAPRVSLEPMSGRLVHELNDTAVARARAGESILVWLKAPDPRFSRDLPFWREAIHVFEGHPLWERVPHPGYADMRFFSVATDFALNLDRLAATLGPGTDLRPVWRRFDARQLFWSEYIVEARLGAGKLTLTTLRFAGGLGIQPDTL